jgi:hypothetical protein
MTGTADDRAGGGLARRMTGPAELQAAHGGGTGGGPGTTRGGGGGGSGPADMEGAPQPGHGPAAERPELGLGEPESLRVRHKLPHSCRAASIAGSAWSGERDVGRTRLGRVEGGGDEGEPGRAGRTAAVDREVPVMNAVR